MREWPNCDEVSLSRYFTYLMYIDMWQAPGHNPASPACAIDRAVDERCARRSESEVERREPHGAGPLAVIGGEKGRIGSNESENERVRPWRR